jgi:hypothetical protein
VGEITNATPDFSAKTLTVTGTPAQIAIATWIFGTLDQPAPANKATQEFLPAGTTNDVLRVMYLTHPQTMASYQEIINAVRTIPEITKVFPYSGQFAIVMRGAASQTAMAEWLFHQLDLTAGLQPPRSLAAHQYVTPGVTNDQVQVLFLSHPWTIQSMQEIVNAVRTIPQLTKVFPYIAAGAISVRGQPSTLALATWLFGQLDQNAPSSAAPAEYQMPGGVDDVTQVFYLGSGNVATLPGVVTAVRAASSKPVFPVTSLNALVMRGTATQVAAADSLIRQMVRP